MLRAAVLSALLAAAAHAAELRDCGDCPALIEVPAGQFQRSDKLDAPQQTVIIARAFALGKFEVTRREFAAFAKQTGFVAAGCELFGMFGAVNDANANWMAPGWDPGNDEPVLCVSWDDARAYADWLSKSTGKRYRLPSEAEWDYAARAGTANDFDYAFRAGLDVLGANCVDCAGFSMMGHDHALTALPVALYPPNRFGLYDMMGNAAEWTEDCFDPSYAGAPRNGTARGDGDCGRRVVRGGNWRSVWTELAPFREGRPVGYRSNAVGFRVLRDLQ